jgi:hypothetical protein
MRVGSLGKALLALSGGPLRMAGKKAIRDADLISQHYAEG